MLPLLHHSDDESSDEEVEAVPVGSKVKVVTGSMVKAVNGWKENLHCEESSEESDSDQECLAKEPGRPDEHGCEWFSAKVVEFAPGRWIKVHLWRSCASACVVNRVHSPVWRDRKGEREVHMLNPNGQGGFKGASPWEEWCKPKEVAVLAAAVCEEVPKGKVVRKWCEDFCF